MVVTGLEVLLKEKIEEFKGASVGIVANHSAITNEMVHVSDALAAAGVKVKALFGPEHGARGDVADGEEIGDSVDRRLGVPIYSLYGEAKSPTAEGLAGLDVMIVDLQDVGARFYTFIYTMANAMASCGKHGVSVWVLDRPNPITGLDAEGPILEPEFSSFVGMYAMPVRHALTLGELARLFAARFGASCDLRVIEMRNWSRDMWFDQTGLAWVMPSPNMPTPDTACVYPGLGFIEGTNLSEARGTTRPFEQFGAPWVDSKRLKETLMEMKLPGVMYREAYFVPLESKWMGEHCAGLQIYVTDRNTFRPVLTGVGVLSALHKVHPDRFEFRPAPAQGRSHFDLLAGNSSLREAIVVGASPWDIADSWTVGLSDYAQVCREIMLY